MEGLGDKEEMNELSLFTGLAGMTLGLRLAGLEVRTVAYCEINKYRQEVIKARIRDGFLDDAPILGDIRACLSAGVFQQFRGLVDIVTAGFPCQAHSVAGRRRGAADDRNLWPETARVIGEVAPRYVLLENVSGIVSNGYALQVIGSLASLGYDCVWGIVSARDVGATHRRNRWWCLAYAECSRRAEAGDRCNQHAGKQFEEGSRTMVYPSTAPWPPGPQEWDRWAEVLKKWPSLEPAVCRVADGISHRVERLKALGDGLVSPVVAEFLRRVG